MKKQHVSLLLAVTLVVLVLTWVGGSTPVAAQTIEVTSADPPTAEQGTLNLDVSIKGKGFDRSAKAKFFLTGTTNPGGITVNSTRFVNNSELMANITVADDAVVAEFDVVVSASKGRTGKGTEIFSVVTKTSKIDYGPTRVFFRDRGVVGSAPGSDVDRIQSDGVWLSPPCTGQYADVDDPCQPGDGVVVMGEAGGGLFLRTLHLQNPNPTRYLVLDFSEPLGDSVCLNVDVQFSDYPGRSPEATSPVNPAACVDFVEVRFSADSAFKAGAQYTMVGMALDAPDLKQGRGKQPDTTQWNAKYYLNFVNPLTITFPDPADPGTVVLTTIDGLEQAELWTVNPKNGGNGELLGTYRMPFSVTLVRLH